MNNSKRDSSVFDDIKVDILSMLENYPSEKVVDAILYEVDEKAIKQLRVFIQRLTMEYGNDEIALKDYNISNIVKIINIQEPCNWYKTFEAKSSKQVNDKEKVLLRLDGEFSKYKNKVLSFTKKKIKEKKIKKDSADAIIKDIHKEIALAEKELKYIQDNFDELDVRISTYFERTSYGGVQYGINKIRQPNQNLRKTVPNVIWFKPLQKEKSSRDDNELEIYFSHATRAFGDVFFAKKSEYLKPRKKGDTNNEQ